MNLIYAKLRYSKSDLAQLAVGSAYERQIAEFQQADLMGKPVIPAAPGEDAGSSLGVGEQCMGRPPPANTS